MEIKTKQLSSNNNMDGKLQEKFQDQKLKKKRNAIAHVFKQCGLSKTTKANLKLT